MKKLNLPVGIYYCENTEKNRKLLEWDGYMYSPLLVVQITNDDQHYAGYARSVLDANWAKDIKKLPMPYRFKLKATKCFTI